MRSKTNRRILQIAGGELGLRSAFFEWVKVLKLHIHRFENSFQSSDLNIRIPNVNNNEDYAAGLLREIDTETKNGNFDTYKLLWLILLGIDGDVDWSVIDGVAKKFIEHDDGGNNYVSKINYYQVLRHRGIVLQDGSVKDIKDIIRRNNQDSAFVLCGNLLLGTASHAMLRECIASRSYDDVLSWPILRLATPQVLFPE